MSVQNAVIEHTLQSAVDLNLYGLMPKHRLLSAHPSINGELIGRINTGVRGPTLKKHRLPGPPFVLPYPRCSPCPSCSRARADGHFPA